MGKFPFKRPRIISKKFPELDSSIDGVTKSLNDLVFSYHEQVGKALSKKHFLMAFSSIALLLVLGSFISMRGKADSSIFYPETCLGGWINPDNAQGEQQTTSNGDETQFTKENSAVLPKNTNAEMYCGNFKGKFDQTTKPTKIIVSLALTKGPELTHEDLVEIGQHVATSTIVVTDIASTTASSTLVLASSSEEIANSTTTVDGTHNASTTEVGTAIATPGSLESSASSIVQGVVESLKDTIHDIFNTSDEPKTQTDTVVVPSSATTETASPEQTKEEQAPVPIPESPTSYVPLREKMISNFIGTVFAEEVEQSTTVTEVTPLSETETIPARVIAEVTSVTETEVSQPTEATPVEAIKTVTATPEEVGKVLGVATTTEVMSATTTEVASTTGDVISATSSDPVVATTTEVVTGTTTEDYQSQNNFLEIFYTFDGEVWKSLGTLNEISMKYRTFEIPITASTSWEDMSKLQVKIEARKHEIDTPVVYLDGIKVEVLYETTLEHVHPDFTRDTILKDEIVDDVRMVTIVNNDTNREEVWYMYLDIATSSRQEMASSTLGVGTSTLLASTTEATAIISKDKQVLATSTRDASSTLLFATSIPMSTSTPLIRPEIPKNVWFKFEGKTQGLSGQELRQQIKKIEEEKLDPHELDRVPDFSMDIIKRIKGVYVNAVVVQVQKENTDELWVYNLEENTQEKIKLGSTTSISSSYPLGVKGGYLFWLSKDEATAYAYDFITKTIVGKSVPVFDGTKGERAEVIFQDIPWKVIVSTEGFFFFSESTGEIFSDENSTVTEAFRKKLNLDSVLNKDELGDFNLTIEETEQGEVLDTTNINQ